MPQSKEEIAESNRVYNQTPNGIKRHRIGTWKFKGIITDDYDALYERFINTSHCEKCDVELTSGGWNTRTTRCVDHDHSIKDRENVRGILCNACNINDRCTNTSGVPNVMYCKSSDRWRYQKRVNGVPHTKKFKTKEEAIRYKYEYET